MLESVRSLVASLVGDRESGPVRGLCRAYLTLPNEEGWFAVDLVPSLWLESLQGCRLSINYGRERPMSEGLELLARQPLASVESLVFYGELGECTQEVFGVLRLERGVLEITQVVPEASATFMAGKSLEDSANLGQLHYGYCRRLGADMSVVSETKITKSWTGGLSARVGSVKDTWLSGQRDVQAGAVRGLYPLNYWSEAALLELRRLEVAWPESFEAMAGLNSIDSACQAFVETRNPRIRPFLRFGLN